MPRGTRKVQNDCESRDTEGRQVHDREESISRDAMYIMFGAEGC